MRFGKRRDPLERELIRNRPEPSRDYVDRLVARVSPTHGAPARRLRLAFAAGLTVSLFVLFAAFGGVGYATSAVSDAVHAVKAAPAHPAARHASSPSSAHKKGHSASPKASASSHKAHASSHKGHSSRGEGHGSRPDDDQYRPGCGKGDRNHIHTGPRGHHHGFPGRCPHTP